MNAVTQQRYRVTCTAARQSELPDMQSSRQQRETSGAVPGRPMREEESLHRH